MPSDRIAVFDSLSADYERAFATFLAHTDQKEKAREWIDQALHGLVRREVFIDAGAGTGKVTAWYLPRFARTLAIEPNPHLREQLAKSCPSAEILTGTILEASPPCAGDFVLCSHVFYYIEPELWQRHLQHLTTFLAPGGLLLIVLQNRDTDCMRMVDHFHGQRFDLQALARGFEGERDAKFAVALETVACHVTAPDFESAYTIAEFMLNLLPLPNPPLRRDVEAYVRERFAAPTGDGYRFTCSQDFLRIQIL